MGSEPRTLGVLKETYPGETRVALTPEIVRKLAKDGAKVLVEPGAGLSASFPDAEYAEAGAELTGRDPLLARAGVLLTVRAPAEADVKRLARGAVVVGLIDPFRSRPLLEALAAQGADAYAMELLPRTTRAQVMDALSSQANLAGYRAVIEAAQVYGRAMPMMMTAAGTVAPAKVFVMGAGVAGLQAIATARRLGAVVTATDVRPDTKEQVESLGGKFIAVEDEEFKAAETAGGYAKEMSAEYRAKQAALVAEHIKQQDIVITTALIPGRKAPVLVNEDMVKTMKAGSVIVDMAVEQGGNCPLSEYGRTVEKYGVKIVGPANLPAELPTDSSSLFSRNLLNFITPMVDKETKTLKIDLNDEVVKGTLVTQNGQIVHPSLTQTSGQN